MVGVYPYRKFIKSLKWSQGTPPVGMSREQRDLLQIGKLIQQKIYGERKPSDVQVIIPSQEETYTVRVRSSSQDSEGIKYFLGLLKFLSEFPEEKAKMPYRIEVEVSAQEPQPAPQGPLAAPDCVEPPVMDPTPP